MKRMTDKMVQQMLTFFAGRLDINNLPLDDAAIVDRAFNACEIVTGNAPQYRRTVNR